MTEKTDRQTLFEKILEENKSRLRIISRANANSDCYLDLEQEILLALWNSLDRYEGRSSLRTWFYGVASNTVSNFLRRNRKISRETELTVAQEPATCSNGHNRDPMAILEEFTRSLNELDRIVFVMYLDNFSYSEMSEAIKVEEANLRVRISRVKKQYESRYVGR